MFNGNIERKLLESQLYCLYIEGELDRSLYIHCLGLENEQIERSIQVVLNRIQTEKLLSIPEKTQDMDVRTNENDGYVHPTFNFD